MKTLVWAGLALVFVFVCCALGAAAMVGLPVTTVGFSIILMLLAASAIVLAVTRPRATPAAVRPAP
jgi:hypothetical protein